MINSIMIMNSITITIYYIPYIYICYYLSRSLGEMESKYRASYLLYILVYMYIIDSIEENLLSPLTIGYDDKPLAFQMRTLSILLMDLRDRVLHVSGAPTNTSIYL